MEKRKSELYVITKAKDLADYVITITEYSPKKYRFTFVGRMQNLCLDIVENLFRANDAYQKDAQGQENRKKFQQEAITDLRLLDYIAMLAMEHHCILQKQYTQIAGLSSETLGLVIAWKNSKDKM